MIYDRLLKTIYMLLESGNSSSLHPKFVFTSSNNVGCLFLFLSYAQCVIMTFILISFACRIDLQLRCTLPQVVDLLWVTSLVDQPVTETCLHIVDFYGTFTVDEECFHPLYKQ